MRHGKAVEHGPVTAVLGAPAEPYTRELLAAVPALDPEAAARRRARRRSRRRCGTGRCVGSRRRCGTGRGDGS
ncbi:hypothetical protein GCM10023097_02710 [Streptomyces collinus]